MTQPLPQLPAAVPAATASCGLGRRAFVGAGAASLLALVLTQACGGDSPTGVNAVITPPPAGSVTFTNGVLTMHLDQLPALTAANGFQVLGLSDGARRADIIVINANGTYRAFSSVCTHEGCTVSGFSNQRMVCPCHGSEYNVSGVPVAGPAPSPLREYAATLNVAAQLLTVSV